MLLGIILIIVAVIALTKLLGNDSKRTKELERVKRRQDEMARAAKEREKEQKALAREQERMAKEQEKQAEQLAKHEKRIANLELRVSQAEYDIQREIENLNYLTAKLSSLDSELEHADWEIENWKKLRKVVEVEKAREKKVKIEDKIFSFENKVRLAEKRLAKAQGIKAIAEAEMSA